MDKSLVVLMGCLLLLAIFLAIMAIGAFVFMLIWNAFIPVAFNGPVLSYPVAFAGWLLLGMVGGAFRSSISAVSKS